MATYYINTASTGSGDGTTVATSGANAAWKTIAEITGEAAGDTISFNKGNTWREQLTVGASGSAGSLITLNAYGEGVAPIINGADLVTVWTAPSEILSNGGFTSDTVGWEAVECTIDSIAGGQSGNCCEMTRVDIAQQFMIQDKTLTAGVAYRLSGYVKSGTSGNEGCTFQIYKAGGNNEQKDATSSASWTQYTKDFICSSTGTYRTYIKKTTATAGTMLFDEISVNKIPNVWQAACTTEPSQVFLDETRGTKQANIVAVDSENDWYWASNILYVYSASDPDTAYTDPGIEASVRDEVVDITTKSYVTFDGLEVRYGCSSGFLIDNGATNITIQDCTIPWNYNEGILIDANGTACTNLLIDSNTITNNSVDTGDIYSTASGPAHTGTISNNTIQAEGLGSTLSNGIYLRSGAFIIEKNTIHDVEHGIIIGTDNTNNTIIRYNYIYDTGDDNIFLTGPDTSNLKSIYYNILVNADDEGIQTASKANIYNNVIYNASDCGILVDNQAITVNIKNNILLENGVGDDETVDYQHEINIAGSNPTITSDYNCIYHPAGVTFMNWEGVAKTWAQWLTDSGQDANSINSNSLTTAPVTGDFTLQITSPCINAGVGVSLTTDYAGNSVLAIPDIGAYEHQGAEAAPSQGEGMHMGMGMGMT